MNKQLFAPIQCRAAGSNFWISSARMLLLAGAVPSIFVMLTVEGCSKDVSTTTPTPPSSESACLAPTNVLPAANEGISVQGNMLKRNGTLWIPHAVQLVAFVQSPQEAALVSGGSQFTPAYNHYCSGPASEMAAVKAWGADAIRMQLSQRATDPTDATYYNPGFVASYVAAVKYARSIGLTVIVSVQAENQPAPYSANTLSSSTTSLWKSLAPQLNGDSGIVYELFNEPDYSSTSYQPTSADWASYNADANSLVSAIRGTGATNVLISDGLNEGQTLYGLVPLSDPNVVYSVHPYFHGSPDQLATTWTTRWGFAAANVPVLAGEWAPLAGQRDFGGYCDGDTVSASEKLLQYIESKGIGLVAVTYDEPIGPWSAGGITYDGDYSGAPTTFVGTTCVNGGIGSSNFSVTPTWGFGKTVQAWYYSPNGTVPATPQ